jgi:uncharacterized protein (DUF1778 family)
MVFLTLTLTDEQVKLAYDLAALDNGKTVSQFIAELIEAAYGECSDALDDARGSER